MEEKDWGDDEIISSQKKKKRNKEREGSKYSLNTEIPERFTNPPRDFQHQ